MTPFFKARPPSEPIGVDFNTSSERIVRTPQKAIVMDFQHFEPSLFLFLKQLAKNNNRRGFRKTSRDTKKTYLNRRHRSTVEPKCSCRQVGTTTWLFSMKARLFPE